MKFTRYLKAIVARLAAVSAADPRFFANSVQMEGSSLPNRHTARPRDVVPRASAI